MVGRAIHSNRESRREQRSRPRRASALLLILIGAGALSLAGFSSKPVLAVGGELKAATLATPTGLMTANGGCEFSNEDTWVSLEWGGSALLDADGNPLINRYPVFYSTSAAGTYTEAGETAGATS